LVGVGRRVGRRGARAAEVGVRPVDAGVDHRDLDALTVVPVEPVPDLRRADQRYAAYVVRRHGLHRVHGHDIRDVQQGVRAYRRDAHLDAVVRRLVVADHVAAEVAHALLGRNLGGAQLVALGLLLATGQR